MRSAAARERDRATIRRLNLEQLARVRERDAGYAEGWRAYRERHSGDAARRPAQAERDRAERDRAEHRRAAAACRAGRRDYCED